MSLSRHRPTTPVTTKLLEKVADAFMRKECTSKGCYAKELLDALSSQESGENVLEKEVMEKVLDKSPVVGNEDEEYEESDDEEMEVLDEHEEINDGDDYVE
ncbi:hypothetical protein Tco_0863415 [Tanacetum coccineum]